MSQVVASLRSRRGLVAAILSIGALAMALVAFLPSPAGALPPNEVIYRYFSDSNTTNLVGYSHLYCSGAREVWGDRTAPYRTIETFPCHDEF